MKPTRNPFAIASSTALLAALALLGTQSARGAGTAYTWNSTSGTDWNTSTNWNPNGLPTAADGVSVTSSGKSIPTISSGTAYAKDLTISSGLTVSQTGGTFNFYHDWKNSGTFNGTGGTVVFAGTAGGGATWAVSGSVNQFFNLQIDSGFDPGFDNDANGSIMVAGNFTDLNTGALGVGQSYTTTFNGTGAQAITTSRGANNSFYNLTVNKSAGAVTINNALKVVGNLTVTAGTLDTSTYSLSRSTAGGTLTVANGSILRIGGTQTLPTNFSTHSVGATSTIEFYGTSQSIPVLNSSQDYGNLAISLSGTGTLAGAETVRGNLALSSGTLATSTSLTMAANSSITRSGGAMTGTIQGSNAYDVSYTGNSKNTGPELSGTGRRNVTVNLTSGQTLTLDQNRSLAGTLQVSGGTFTASNDLGVTGTTTVGSKLSIASAGTLTGAGGVSIAGGEFNYNSTTALSKTVSFSGTGGKLSGTGAITPAITISANNTLAPTAQASGSKMTFGSTVAFTASSIFEWDLNATNGLDPGAGTSNSGTYGQAAATGAASGTAIFNIVLGTNSYANAFWDTNKNWTNIFSASGLTALNTLFTTFSGTGLTATGSGATAIATAPGEGHFSFSGTTLNWTAVPEPSSALAALLLGAGLLRRRR